MAIINPPAWLQFRTDHPAALYRRMLKGLLGGASALGGIVDAGDYAVTQQTTANMTVRVAAGGAFVLGTSSTTLQGAYYVHNDASVTLTIAAADASLTRYDLVVLQVRDQEYAGTTNDATLSVVQGTPAATPAEPAVPANSLVLARVTVAAGATTVTSANIADRRVRASSPPLVAASATARDAMGVTREGQLVFRSDLDRLQVYDGTIWRAIEHQPSDTGWLAVGASSVTVSTGWGDTNTRIRAIGNRVYFDAQVERTGAALAAGSSTGNITDVNVFVLAAAYRPAVMPGAARTGGQRFLMYGSVTGDSAAQLWIDPLTGNIDLSAVSPGYVVGVGDRVRVQGHWTTD